MAFNIDITTPADTSLISAFPLNERNNRITLEGIITNDHIEATGDHDKVGLRQRTVGGGDQPAADGTLGFLFCEDVAGITELFYQDDTPNPIQITSNGVLAPDKLPLAGGTMTGNIVLDPSVKVTADNNNSGMRGETIVPGVYRRLIDMENATDTIRVGDQSDVIHILCDTENNYIANYAGSGGTKFFWHSGNMGAGKGLDADLVDGVEGVAIFSSLVSGAGQFFESAPLPDTKATGGSLPHGITGIPRIVMGYLKCDVPTSSGYIQNDEIVVSSSLRIDEKNRGLATGADATNVFYRIGADTFPFVGLDKATGISSTLVQGDWKVIIRAWK